jgi:hypothetical protein
LRLRAIVSQYHAVGTGISVTALIVLTVRLLHLPHPPLTSVVVLPAAAAILGAGGALFGKRFGYRTLMS